MTATTASVATLCEVNPRLRSKLASSDLVAFVGMADVDATAAVAIDSEQRPYSAVAKAYTPFENGDILVAKITPCFENGKIAQASVSTGIAFGSTEFHVLRPGTQLDRRYLLHFLRRPSVLRLGEQRMTGAGGQRRVPSRLFDELEIPLLPLEEQQRIASILDAADALRTKRRQALEKLDSLTQSIFIDMFGDLARNTKGLPLMCVGDFTEGFETGKSVAAGPDDLPGGYRVLKVSAVTRRVYLPSESKPVPISYDPPSQHLVREGDLLFSRANTTELVGACAYVHATPPGLLLPDKLWRFVWRQPRSVEPLYIWKALQGPKARRDIGDLATGSSGSMKNISQEKFLRLQLPVPALELQRVFVERYQEIHQLRADAERQACSIDKLFASLQHRAFRGEL